MPQWRTVPGIVQRGHRIASGQASDSPYPAGSIELQTPFFREHDLDLSAFHPATLNISIQPYSFEVKAPQYTFRQVNWIDVIPPEDFSFSPCQLSFDKQWYKALVYYPHPDTKLAHFHDGSTIEIIAPFIPAIRYGDTVQLKLDTQQIKLLEK